MITDLRDRPSNAHVSRCPAAGEVSGDQSSVAPGTSQSPSSERSSELNHGRYDENAIVLRVEYISDADARRALIALKGSVYAAVVALIILVVLKSGNHAGHFFVLSLGFQIFSLALGGLLFAFMFTYYVGWIIHLAVCVRAGKYWSPRRRKPVINNAIRGALTSTVLGLHVAANTLVIAYPDVWCSGRIVNVLALLTWSCWNYLLAALVYDVHCLVLIRDRGNAHNRDHTVRDQPLIYHWPKAVIWSFIEGMLIWSAVSGVNKGVVKIQFEDPSDHACTWGANLQCYPAGTIVTSTSLALGGFGLYWLLAVCYLFIAWKRVHQRPYRDFKVLHMLLRLQVRYLMAFSIVILSVVLLWIVGPDECANYALSWFGMIPMILTMSGIEWLALYLTSPRHPQAGPPKMNEIFQEFAWTEASKQAQIDERNRQFMRDDITDEPMFCFETAIKLYYWAALIYHFTEVDGQSCEDIPESIRELQAEVDQAMSFYRLRRRRLFFDRKLETKVLSAWNDRTIVVSIRGSSAAANFIADAQFTQTPHPPKRKVDGRTPRVHRGFLSTWQAGGINDMVTQHVAQLIDSAEDRSKVRVLITGHSLGGAVALLAAYDITNACKLRQDQVAVYTFGSPRVGNRSFARDYINVAPDTWSIINDQDVVTRAMKLFGFYKRAGHRVIINSVGDLIVRPTMFEVTLMQTPFRASPTDHITVSYRKALHSVVLGQMKKGKRYREGLAGVLHLLNSAPQVHDAMDELARKQGTSLLDQIRSISWGSLDLGSEARLPSTERPSSASRAASLEAAVEAAVRDVPLRRTESGTTVYEPVHEGLLSGVDEVGARRSAGSNAEATSDDAHGPLARSTAPDSVAVDMPPSMHGRRSHGPLGDEASGDVLGVGYLLHMMHHQLRTRGGEADAVVRLAMEDAAEAGRVPEADAPQPRPPMTDAHEPASATHKPHQQPRDAQADRIGRGDSSRGARPADSRRRHVSMARLWQRALRDAARAGQDIVDNAHDVVQETAHGTGRAAAMTARNVIERVHAPRVPLQGRHSDVGTGAAARASRRSCYVIVEADGDEAASRDGERVGQKGWRCPLSAPDNALPSNTTLSADGNIVVVDDVTGGLPNMRACRDLRRNMCTDTISCAQNSTGLS